MLTFLLLFSQAQAIPCAAHVEGQQIILIQEITFNPRTAVLTQESASLVQGVVCLLGEQPDLTVQVEVHTDTRGSEIYNLEMSQQRADAFRDALAQKIDPARLTAVGYGEAYPNEQRAGRTELFISPPDARPPKPIIKIPEPEPEPVYRPYVPTLCELLRNMGPGTPSIPGATCQSTDFGWQCEFTRSAASLSGSVKDCIGGSLDGDELYLNTPTAEISVTSKSSKAVLTYRESARYHNRGAD